MRSCNASRPRLKSRFPITARSTSKCVEKKALLPLPIAAEKQQQGLYAVQLSQANYSCRMQAALRPHCSPYTRPQSHTQPHTQHYFLMETSLFYSSFTTTAATQVMWSDGVERARNSGAVA